MTDQLVIGAGEVGIALAEVLDCELRDIAEREGLLDRYDVLHIAYPWQIPDFVQTTRGYQHRYNADLVVVHSTVPVGTCDANSWVHSPVRGKHPKLDHGLITFVKHFGGEAAEWAASLWPLDSNVQVHDKAATTEAGKLMELAMYGVQIMMQKEIMEFCEANELPFLEVYTEMAGSYNRGWEALGHKEYVRPIIKHMPGSISGHCVIAGAEMLPRKGFVEYLLAQDNIR